MLSGLALGQVWAGFPPRRMGRQQQDLARPSPTSRERKAALTPNPERGEIVVFLASPQQRHPAS